MNRIIAAVILTIFVTKGYAQQSGSNNVIQIIFTSDAHYGITRKTFQGHDSVSASVVNAAMIKKINVLPAVALPEDGGLNAGKTIGSIDYLVEGGDIANRMEVPIQSAAASWRQFEAGYIKGLTLKGSTGAPIKLFLVPGNHDISDAIGFYKKMAPLTDATSMANIYNRMLQPARPLTKDSYDYTKDKINYSKNIGGIHFVFVTLWPDSLERIWMEKDLQTVAATTPVIIFTHDQPECEAKHFTNPKPGHTINDKDKFENLVAEQYKEGDSTKADGGATAFEQRGWVAFLKNHPNIKAYFHGNSNWNEFYIYTGPDKDVALNTFRADSPMKGKYSSRDETKLSFQLITLDTKSGQMTVRECLWNTDPTNPKKPVQWGASKTISLK
jgi:hypothetical protein